MNTNVFSVHAGNHLFKINKNEMKCQSQILYSLLHKAAAADKEPTTYDEFNAHEFYLNKLKTHVSITRRSIHCSKVTKVS